MSVWIFMYMSVNVCYLKIYIFSLIYFSLNVLLFRAKVWDVFMSLGIFINVQSSKRNLLILLINVITNLLFLWCNFCAVFCDIVWNFRTSFICHLIFVWLMILCVIAVDHLFRPKLAPAIQCSVERIVIRFGPSLEKFEEELTLSVQNEYCQQQQLQAGGTAQVVKRYMRVLVVLHVFLTILLSFCASLHCLYFSVHIMLHFQSVFRWTEDSTKRMYLPSAKVHFSLRIDLWHFKRFGKCSVSVKLSLFRAYCMCFYNIGLWSKYSVTVFKRIEAC